MTMLFGPELAELCKNLYFSQKSMTKWWCVTKLVWAPATEDFHGNSWMIPMDSHWNLNGISVDSWWNFREISWSKFNYCKNRVQHQCILNTYLSRIHMGWVEELRLDEGLHLCSENYQVHTLFKEAQTMIDAKSELYHPCNLITVIFLSPLYEYKH